MIVLGSEDEEQKVIPVDLFNKLYTPIPVTLP